MSLLRFSISLNEETIIRSVQTDFHAISRGKTNENKADKSL